MPILHDNRLRSDERPRVASSRTYWKSSLFKYTTALNTAESDPDDNSHEYYKQLHVAMHCKIGKLQADSHSQSNGYSP